MDVIPLGEIALVPQKTFLTFDYDVGYQVRILSNDPYKSEIYQVSQADFDQVKQACGLKSIGYKYIDEEKLFASMGFPVDGTAIVNEIVRHKKLNDMPKVYRLWDYTKSTTDYYHAFVYLGEPK